MPAVRRLQLAEEFLASAESDREAGRPNAAASAAIHTGIYASDAVCLALIGERSKGPSHGEALRLLQRACRGTRHEADAGARVRQLSQILALKPDAEYGGRGVTSDEATRVVERARRFVGWASSIVRAA
jgi:HEPN domain-containing protein